MSSAYDILGDRASRPCDFADAHGVGMLCEQEGLDFKYTPFKHPSLLDDEVRVRVTHSGLCQSDIFVMKNAWKISHFPMVPGHEIFGIVTEVGEKVTRFNVGDRVGHGPHRDCCGNCSDCSECRIGFNNTCPKQAFTVGLHFGGWATSFQSKAKSFVKLREELPGSSAPLMCAGLTVFSPLSRDVTPGMKVGVVGVGGLGHLGIIIANKMGCEVTAISTSPDKEAEARSLGAHDFINSRDEGQLMMKSCSLDYILDTAVAYSLDTTLPLLRPHGIVNIVGAPDKPTQNKFNAFDVVSKNLTVKGSAAGSRIDMENMVDFCATHNVQTMSEIYRFDQGKEAVESLANGIPRAPRYRAVFDMAGYEFKNN